MICVAPHAGAWIETTNTKRTGLLPSVAPCGIVDLNQMDTDEMVYIGVASHAGPWIETSRTRRTSKSRHAALHACGAWVEMTYRPKPEQRRRGAPHLGAWV